MKKICIGLLIGFVMIMTARTANGQKRSNGNERAFDITSINPAILPHDAEAIVRLDEQHLEVISKSKAIWRIHKVITILNEKGRPFSKATLHYNKFNKPKRFDVQIRDAQGNVVRKLKKKEILDYSAISGYSLYSDGRVKSTEMVNGTYPFTVEYWFEVELDGYISWPSWYPDAMGLAVEEARFQVTSPAGLPVRYSTSGYAKEPQIGQGHTHKSYTWKVSGLTKKTPDLLASLTADVVPIRDVFGVKIAPHVFEIDGFEGRMDTWNAFGSWYNTLNHDRGTLPQEKRTEVLALVEGIEDPIERARLVYKYFQESTRYVSVQLGIGGWRSYPASYVAENGYGDCKALTTYLRALLEAAGVESQPALIQSNPAGSSVEQEFPNNEFNHVILMVPMEADTLWLEATSQIIPFGQIGMSNEDRYALAVSQQGGALVRTPMSAPQDNKRIRTAEVLIDKSGSATGQVTLKYTGNQQHRVMHKVVGVSQREKMEWVQEELEVPSFEVKSVDFSAVQAREVEAVVNVSLELPKYASRSGSRLFIPLSMLERQTYVPPADEFRTSPHRIYYPYYDEDRVEYALPAGYKVEAMPEDVAIETSFARYSSSYALQDGRLIYKRVLELKVNEIEPALYNSYRNFMLDVVKSDRAQGVLVKD